MIITVFEQKIGVILLHEFLFGTTNHMCRKYQTH